MSFQAQARALGDPTRYGIFRYLVAADRPVDVPELTAEFGCHHNAIRQHLDKLMAAGLVVETPGPRGARGRPRLHYRVDPWADERWGARGPYERLSAILADALRAGTSAREAGRRAGAAAVAARGELGDAVTLVAEVMARNGFEPHVIDAADGADVVLRACPFAHAAAGAPEVVCAVHRGIAEGVVAASDGTVEVADLVVEDPAVAGCRLVLRRAPSG